MPQDKKGKKDSVCLAIFNHGTPRLREPPEVSRLKGHEAVSGSNDGRCWDTGTALIGPEPSQQAVAGRSRWCWREAANGGAAENCLMRGEPEG